MGTRIQYRLSHLLAAVAFVSGLAYIAAQFQWAAATWLRNCFVLGFAACGLMLVLGFAMVPVTSFRRRKRRLPTTIDAVEGAALPASDARRVRISKPSRRQTIGFKW
jgi:hypothetical protein